MSGVRRHGAVELSENPVNMVTVTMFTVFFLDSCQARTPALLRYQGTAKAESQVPGDGRAAQTGARQGPGADFLRFGSLLAGVERQEFPPFGRRPATSPGAQIQKPGEAIGAPIDR